MNGDPVRVEIMLHYDGIWKCKGPTKCFFLKLWYRSSCVFDSLTQKLVCIPVLIFLTNFLRLMHRSNCRASQGYETWNGYILTLTYTPKPYSPFCFYSTIPLKEKSHSSFVFIPRHKLGSNFQKLHPKQSIIPPRRGGWNRRASVPRRL